MNRREARAVLTSLRRDLDQLEAGGLVQNYAAIADTDTAIFLVTSLWSRCCRAVGLLAQTLQRVDALQAECDDLRRQLADQQASHAAAIRAVEAEYREAKALHDEMVRVRTAYADRL